MFFVVISLGLLFSTCKKNTSDSSQPIFSAGFSTQSELNSWNQSDGGEAVIDSSAVKFTNITGCYHFETVNLIPVVQGKTYELQVRGKVNGSIAGDPMLCAGDFIVWVVQGSANVLSQSFGNYPSWTTKSFSFTATSSSSVKIEFLIGTTRGAWIDDIKLFEK